MLEYVSYKNMHKGSSCPRQRRVRKLHTCISIGDIAETVEDNNVAQDGSEELFNAEIVHLDRYKFCLRCKARVEPSDVAIPDRNVQCCRDLMYMYAPKMSLQNFCS